MFCQTYFYYYFLLKLRGENAEGHSFSTLSFNFCVPLCEFRILINQFNEIGEPVPAESCTAAMKQKKEEKGEQYGGGMEGGIKRGESVKSPDILW